jgi:hypothetical protein
MGAPPALTRPSSRYRSSLQQSCQRQLKIDQFSAIEFRPVLVLVGVGRVGGDTAEVSVFEPVGVAA